jgi:AraC-like DNA-binding protein
MLNPIPTPGIKGRYKPPMHTDALSVCRLEEMYQPSNELLPQCERTDRFEILFVTQGTGTLNMDTEHYQIEVNALFVISPRVVRRIIPATGLCGYYIAFSREYLYMVYEQFNLQFLVNSQCSTKVEFKNRSTVEEIGNLLRRLLEEFNEENRLRADLLKGYFKILLLQLSREMKLDVDGVLMRDKVLLHQFLTLVKENVREKKSVAEYADVLCVSTNYLNTIIKKVSGVTASAHIQQHIVLEAKRQAIHSGLCMKEIALNLGFFDMAHFSKYFKSYSGTSFTDFRREAQRLSGLKIAVQV